jgi:hypothetical protein
MGGLFVAVVVVLMWTTGSTGIIGNGWRWAGPVFGVFAAAAIGLLLALTAGRPVLTRAAIFTIVALVSASVPSKILYGLASPLARVQEGSMSTVLFEQRPKYIETIDLERQTGWTDTQAEAAQWLRGNSALDDLLATNLTLSALVPALTGRTTYISDIHMQAPYGRTSDVLEIQRREAASWAFINEPSKESVEPLCQAGVRWIWVDPQRAASENWGPFAEKQFSRDDVVILEVNRSFCG